MNRRCETTPEPSEKKTTIEFENNYDRARFKARSRELDEIKKKSQIVSTDSLQVTSNEK
jgi:hypothetical protein